MKVKVNPKVLSILVSGLGVAGAVLSSIVEKNERNALKDELRKEIINLADLHDEVFACLLVREAVYRVECLGNLQRRQSRLAVERHL